jgi:hypothetical protein
MCGATYLRPNGTTVPCSFLTGHTAEHSWRTLRLQDEQESVVPGQLDLQVGLFLEAVACGDLDIYLEAILAGCHERKRTKRGVWTTPPSGGKHS